MAYNPTVWETGDVVTSIKLNKAENAIAANSTAIEGLASDVAADFATIAPNFLTTKAYTAGEYVYYNDLLYRFTADHAAGAWVGTDATQVTLGGDVTDLKNDTSLLYAYNDVASWEVGSFNGSNGTNYNSTTTIIRTPYFLDDNISKAYTLNQYKFSVWAWEKSTGNYVGVLKTNNTFEKNSTNVAYFQQFDFSAYPSYKFKVAMKNQAVTTVTASDGANFKAGKFMADCQIVKTNSDMADTTANNVVVLQNSSPFGDGGTCVFEKTTDTLWSISRKDGSYLRPFPGQGNLFAQKINVKTLLNTINGYIGNESLIYGSDNTLFDSTCTNEIDCSAFVNAILNCITYNNSRYNLGSSASNKRLFGGYGNTLNERMYSGQLASWFAQRKQLYTIPSDMAKLTRLLQPGDLLFFGGDSDTDKIYGIGHVVIVLASLYPTYYKAIIAQAGGAPNADNLNTTVGKISIAHLETSFNAGKVKAWARPTYNIDYMSETPGLEKMLGGSYYFDTAFIPGVFLDTSGNVSYSNSWSGDPVMYNVIPGKSIKNTSALLGRIAFYDADKTFIRRVDIAANASVTVDNTARYARFITSTTVLSTALQSKFMMS